MFRLSSCFWSSADNDKVEPLFIVEAGKNADSEPSFHCICDRVDLGVESPRSLIVGPPTRFLVPEAAISLEQSSDCGRCKVVVSHVDGVKIVLNDKGGHSEDIVSECVS